MKHLYYAAFASGLSEIAKSALLQACPLASILCVYENGLIFKTEKPSPPFFSIPGMRVCAPLLARWSLNNPLPENAACELPKHLADLPRMNGAGFRFNVYDGNVPVGISEKIRGRIVKKIASLSGMRLDNRKPSVELRLLIRVSGEALLLFCRIDRKKHEPRRGEIPPDIAHLITLYSEPQEDDVVLDPCCGYGGIVRARVGLPFRAAFAYDNDPVLISRLKKESAGWNSKIRRSLFVKRRDMFTELEFDREFVTAILCDAPWGDFDKTIRDISKYYAKLTAVLAGIIAANGRIIMICGRNIGLQQIIDANRIPLTVDKKTDFLLSGKKATLYWIEKTDISRANL